MVYRDASERRLSDYPRPSVAVDTAVLTVLDDQLQVFDALDRDDRGWVLSVAHWAAVTASRLTGVAASVELVPVEGVDDLRYDHAEIVRLAVDELRSRYLVAPDPAQLLDEPFTLLELQRLHEAVAGDRLMRDTFRRRMQPLVRPTGRQARGVVGKPAQEFERK